MKIFPAIDIKDKKCVRLIKGDFENKTDYPEGVVANMLKAFSKLKVENQQLMRTFFEAQKEYFSRDDWNLIKKFK